MFKPKQKPHAKASTIDPAFAAAETRWKQIEAQSRDRDREIQSIKCALSLAINEADRTSDRTAFAREIAGTNLALAMRRPEKLGERLTDLQFERDELHPAFCREYEAYEAAVRAETTRQALLLQNRQKQAVKSIASALESLSQAISAEREVRAELASKAPLER